MPFHEFSGRDVIEARALVRVLAERLRARLARRERRRRRGRVDLRRTLRAAVTTGGVPLRLAFRGRRPQRPDLVALCDLSGSVAAASELCLALIAPAAAFFRRVHLFAYVDRLCPVSIEDGHVAPGAPLDLHARSDFGHVLDDLWRTQQAALHRGTVVLVLGDARNNRRPPRGRAAARDPRPRPARRVARPRSRRPLGHGRQRALALRASLRRRARVHDARRARARRAPRPVASTAGAHYGVRGKLNDWAPPGAGSTTVPEKPPLLKVPLIVRVGSCVHENNGAPGRHPIPA